MSKDARDRLVALLDAEFRHEAGLTGIDRMSARVREAIGSVPRERFVPEGESQAAYADVPLPIGFGQTISQPYIVALMTELLALAADDVVLEIGTGSGYQAAVLARLVTRLYSVEVVPELAERASRLLAELGCSNVEVRTGNGRKGWPEHAPFAGIVVTAASDDVPTALVDQLAVGGRLVIPVGGRWQQQQLLRLTKQADGSVTTEDLLAVAFVPLIHPTA